MFQSLKRLALALPLAALSLGAVAVAASPAAAQLFDPETATLDNGMEVVVITNDRLPVVTHMVWYRVGGADEPRGKSGIAHFLEHLLFKGTTNAPEGEFSDAIRRVGGSENAFTSYDYTAYFQNVPVSALEEMMRYEADRMVNLDIDESDIGPERDVILEERRSRVDNNPAALFREQVQAATYLHYPYRIPLIGWKHEMERLGLRDALDFYDRWYTPSNAILVVAGDVTLADVLPLAEKTYGQIPARAVPPRERSVEPPQLAERRLEMTSDQVAQPSFSRRYLAPGYNWGDTEHAYPLQILAEVLSGGATGRLYRSLVVEQKIAASAGAWYSPDGVGPSGFGFYGSPRPGGDIGAVEAAIDAEIATLLADGVTQEEVDRAIARVTAAAVYARDGVSGPARIFGLALATGQTVEDVEAWPARIAEVTAEQVNAAARAVFRQDQSVTGILRPAPVTDRQEG
ncbi:MAG: insulinase family protein [Alphaproteobacteria bacterium]|nr:insulinase family protein [Alphaproteobacteria bacterium]